MTQSITGRFWSGDPEVCTNMAKAAEELRASFAAQGIECEVEIGLADDPLPDDDDDDGWSDEEIALAESFSRFHEQVADMNAEERAT